MLKGLNHLTISVSDLNKSLDFYNGILEMELKAKWDEGAYLESGNLWLCLSVQTAQGLEKSAVRNYTHYAFTIEETDFECFKEKVLKSRTKIWKENKSQGKSIYFLDPDGHQLEAHVGNLKNRLESCKENPYRGMEFY